MQRSQMNTEWQEIVACPAWVDSGAFHRLLWNAAPVDATGVRIGIIDAAFARDLPWHVESFGTNAPSRFARQHGTATAHVIASAARGAALLCASVIDATGAAASTAVAAALRWLHGHGARVIAIPLGDDEDHAEIARALDDILSATAPPIVIASHGNAFGGSALYPARDPRVIGVGAAGSNGVLLASAAREPYPELVVPADSSSVACAIATAAAASVLARTPDLRCGELLHTLTTARTIR
ncbi:MAG TPA: S8/S53 family peptidase [Kofleriaceae bacterium]|nr:S8/S53 family peptidase [Kofleriaceae bacterium]